MRLVNLPLRRAIVAKIGTITYRTVSVPVWQDFNGGSTADINVGNNLPVKAWIRLLNQTADDDSPKCQRADIASIQIQVQVSFNANTGNYEHSELIMDQVLENIFNGNSSDIEIESPFTISLMEKVSERNLSFRNNNETVYMTMVVIRCRITQ